MSPQVQRVEVSTKIPYTFINNKTLHWYKEKSCMGGPQNMTDDPSYKVGDKFYWMDVSHPHMNEGDPISDILFGYTNETLQVDMVDSSTNRLENVVAERFISVNEVEYVFLSLENDSINIWTVINKLDRKVRERIYDVEYDILDILKGFQFDFHVICRNDRIIEGLCPSNARMIFPKIANLKTYAQ